MSWFQSLTGALGAGSSTASNNSSASTNSGGDNSSGPSNTFDNSGNPVSGDSPRGSSSNDNSGNSQNAQERQATGTTQKSQSIEELLFAPVENKSNPNPNPNPNPDPKSGTNEQELAPGLTSAKLVQNLQSVNFMGTIPKETITAAMNGDSEAFSQVMSSVAQVSAAIAIHQSIAANKSAMDQRFTEFDGKLTSKIGETKYSDILADPKFSSPFVRPLAENLIGRLRERDSSITPDQIKQVLPNLIQHAMKSFGSTDAPLPKGNPNAKTQPREIKYDELFD